MLRGWVPRSFQVAEQCLDPSIQGDAREFVIDLTMDRAILLEEVPGSSLESMVSRGLMSRDDFSLMMQSRASAIRFRVYKKRVDCVRRLLFGFLVPLALQSQCVELGCVISVNFIPGSSHCSSHYRRSVARLQSRRLAGVLLQSL